MPVAELVQIGSLLVVATALVFNAIQVRLLARQNQTLTGTAEKSAYDALAATQAQSRVTFFIDDPALLEWYLTTRGVPSCGEERNKRVLYAMYKFDLHEYNYVNHRRGHLEADVWTSWQGVVERDLAVEEFRYVWRHARTWYVRQFVQYIDDLFDRVQPFLPDSPDSDGSEPE